MILAPSSMRRGHLRGFTLIELLVVIAIIGILSAVVLASLNTARSKGNDASAKANLDTIRTQSAIYYDSNNAYNMAATTGVVIAPSGAGCQVATSLFTDTNVLNALKGADSALGGTFPANVKCQIGYSSTNVSNAVSATIGANQANFWTVYVPLTNNPTGMPGWCVDSSGVSKADTIPVSGTVACPP